jgi:hypothetical protein
MKLKPWNLYEHLQTQEDIVAYVNTCLAEGDTDLIVHTLHTLVKHKGVNTVSGAATVAQGNPGPTLCRPGACDLAASNSAPESARQAGNQQVMEELRRRVITILQENPWPSDELLAPSGITADQVQALLAKPVTPLSTGLLIQLALALELPIRILLDEPTHASEDAARGATPRSRDGQAIDDLSGSTTCEK